VSSGGSSRAGSPAIKRPVAGHLFHRDTRLPKVALIEMTTRSGAGHPTTRSGSQPARKGHVLKA
jgi:hypothetical protein